MPFLQRLRLLMERFELVRKQFFNEEKTGKKLIGVQGLDEDEIQSLAKSKNDVIKASRRDLAYIVSQVRLHTLQVVTD